MKKDKLIFVGSDDWEGLYINGKLIMEDHHLDVFKILKAIDIKYQYIEADDDWICERGTLPENIKEVKEAQE